MRERAYIILSCETVNVKQFGIFCKNKTTIQDYFLKAVTIRDKEKILVSSYLRVQS